MTGKPVRTAAKFPDMGYCCFFPGQPHVYSVTLDQPTDQPGLNTGDSYRTAPATLS
jgi:hypothetical protein